MGNNGCKKNSPKNGSRQLFGSIGRDNRRFMGIRIVLVGTGGFMRFYVNLV